MVTDHYSLLLQPEGSHRNISMNEQDCVTIKLYLWSSEFELHIIFMCYKIFFFFWFFFFHSFKNVKHYPNFWAVQKPDSSYVWPMAEACWSWTKLSIKHEGRTCLFSDPERVTQKDDLPQPFPRKFFGEVSWQMGGSKPDNEEVESRKEKTKLAMEWKEVMKWLM